MTQFICSCCGNDTFVRQDVIWPQLASEWRLAPDEIAYVNEQQGLQCARCHSCLRTQALAGALARTLGYRGWFQDVRPFLEKSGQRILEINPSARLTRFWAGAPNHTLVSYPAVDMMSLPFPDASYDVVVHSDTLEHVASPVRALAECYRVLKPDGRCIYTVPIIVGRLTARRDGLPVSYHGGGAGEGMSPVVTEYGADAWRQTIEAGFSECTIYAHRFPASLVLLAKKY